MAALSFIVGLVGLVIAALLVYGAFLSIKKNGFGILPIGLGVVAIFVAFIGFTIGGSFGQIENGEIGLQKDFGGFTGKSFLPGLYTTPPVTTSVEVVDITTHTSTVQQTITTNDQQVIPIEAKITYNLDQNPAHLIKTMTFIGPEYYKIAVEAQVEGALKAKLSPYKYPDLNQNLDTASRLVQQDTETRISQIQGTDAIHIAQVTLTQVNPTEAYKQAGEAKAIASQQASTAKIQLDKINYETQAKVIVAKGQAEAQAAQARTITPDYLKLQQLEIAKAAVEKWDGHIQTFAANPFGGAENVLPGNSILDMRSLTAGSKN